MLCTRLIKEGNRFAHARHASYLLRSTQLVRTLPNHRSGLCLRQLLYKDVLAIGKGLFA